MVTFPFYSVLVIIKKDARHSLRIAVYHYGYERELFIVQQYCTSTSVITFVNRILYLLPQRRKTKTDERQLVDRPVLVGEGGGG